MQTECFLSLFPSDNTELRIRSEIKEKWRNKTGYNDYSTEPIGLPARTDFMEVPTHFIIGRLSQKPGFELLHRLKTVPFGKHEICLDKHWQLLENGLVVFEQPTWCAYRDALLNRYREIVNGSVNSRRGFGANRGHPDIQPFRGVLLVGGFIEDRESTESIYPLSHNRAVSEPDFALVTKPRKEFANYETAPLIGTVTYTYFGAPGIAAISWEIEGLLRVKKDQG